jgi:hypothetical protein
LEKSARVPAVPANSPIQHAASQLQTAIQALLDHRWEERLRRRAEERANLLTTACRKAKLPRATRAAQALQSLLSLEEEDLYCIHDPLRHKLFELLELVRIFADVPASVGKSG